MKVLHIWNTSGSGSIIAKYTDKIYGTKSWVVMRKSFDKFNFTTYGECWDCGAKIFTLRALWKARKYNLIHVHSFDKIVPLLKMFYPKKPVVLHYRGTDIRGRWNERRKYWSKANLILVSTPDLIDSKAPKEAIYLPNPVDTELFYPKCTPKSKTAFHISYNADDLAERYAKQYGLRLTIHDREEKPIIYTKLADVLSKYEYYIDVKRAMEPKIVLRALSKTALEALACGCKVIRWDGKIVDNLPTMHRPEHTVKELWKLYKSLVQEKIS